MSDFIGYFKFRMEQENGIKQALRSTVTEKYWPRKNIYSIFAWGFLPFKPWSGRGTYLLMNCTSDISAEETLGFFFFFFFFYLLEKCTSVKNAFDFNLLSLWFALKIFGIK